MRAFWIPRHAREAALWLYHHSLSLTGAPTFPLFMRATPQRRFIEAALRYYHLSQLAKREIGAGATGFVIRCFGCAL